MRRCDNRTFRAAFILLAPLLLGGCPSVQPRVPAGPALVQQGSDLRHAGSGMIFPPVVEGFQRNAAVTYDAAGQDISVGYNLTTSNGPIVATVYVYPAPSLISFGSSDNVVADASMHLARAEFDRRKQEVTLGHTGVVLLDERRATVVQEGVSLDGWRATFSYTQNFFGVPQALQSDLFIFCYVGKVWALEYRFSYPERTAPRAEVDEFMRSLRITIPRG